MDSTTLTIALEGDAITLDLFAEALRRLNALITAIATWFLESGLIREALGAVRAREPDPQVSTL